MPESTGVKENKGLPVDFKVTDDPDAWRFASTNTGAERVEGLGDEAFWNPVLSSLAVKKSDQAFIGMFTHRMVDEPDMKEGDRLRPQSRREDVMASPSAICRSVE